MTLEAVALTLLCGQDQCPPGYRCCGPIVQGVGGTLVKPLFNGEEATDFG